jgi:DNA (cytosine-5)-methyltransferase 1
MRVLDLFSGIGAFSLGLERASMKTVAFCEIDPFCRRVLAKHWPEVKCRNDILMSQFDRREADVICGGFPCQDISDAGLRTGLAGSSSRLWWGMVRAIRMVRPVYAIVENVAALLGRGMGGVCGSLAEIGYDAEWHCIPASAVGAPHRRDRIWIVAYPASEGQPQQEGSGVQIRGRGTLELAGLLGQSGASWLTEPDVGRVAHGVASRVDRLRGLGNSLVPQIPELIGRAIVAGQARR